MPDDAPPGDVDGSGDADGAAAIDVVLIAAIAENGVIGADGGMPWHYPADLAHFKETTMGHPVVLGRRTYESIAGRLGGPLPGRTNVVLSRSGFDPEPGDGEGGDGDGTGGEDGGDSDRDGETSVVVAGGVDEALAAAAATGADTAYVAGGATVYEQTLPRADRLVVTEVPGSPDGDAYFPEWDREDWREVARESDGDLSFVTYERA